MYLNFKMHINVNKRRVYVVKLTVSLQAKVFYSSVNIIQGNSTISSTVKIFDKTQNEADPRYDFNS